VEEEEGDEVVVSPRLSCRRAVDGFGGKDSEEEEGGEFEGKDDEEVV